MLWNRIVNYIDYLWAQNNARADQAVGALTNRAFVTNQSTSNAQGQTNVNSIIAVAALNARVSGVFYWHVSFLYAAAAADVCTARVQRQTNVGGVAAISTTGGPVINAPGYVAAATNGCIISTGAPGTGITITAGGGGATTLDQTQITEGTAAVGWSYAKSGMSAVALGSSFILTLDVTNSVANRACSAISILLVEQP